MSRWLFIILFLYILSSCAKDDRIWNETTFPGLKFEGVAYANNQFVVIGRTTGDRFVSLISGDLVNWRENITSIPCNIMNLKWMNNQYTSNCYYFNSNKASFLLSNDGAVWTQKIVSKDICNSLDNNSPIAWDNKKYITGCGYGGTGIQDMLMVSFDLIHWNKTSTGTQGKYFQSLYYINGIYFAFTEDSLNRKYIYSSTDGSSWLEITMLRGILINDIFYDGKKIIIIGENGSLYTSTDGENWENHSVIFGPIFEHIAYGSSEYFLLPYMPFSGNKGSMEIWSTPDFFSWKSYVYKEAVTGLNFDEYDRKMSGVATDGKNVVVVGYEGHNWSYEGGGYTGFILTSQ